MTKSKKILNIFTVVLVLLLLGCTAASLIRRARTEPIVEVTVPEREEAEMDGIFVTLYRLPASAVLEDGGGAFVWVTRESVGLFGPVYDVERVPVDVLEAADGQVVLTSPVLRWWDSVIADPGDRIRNGARVRMGETEKSS